MELKELEIQLSHHSLLLQEAQKRHDTSLKALESSLEKTCPFQLVACQEQIISFKKSYASLKVKHGNMIKLLDDLMTPTDDTSLHQTLGSLSKVKEDNQIDPTQDPNTSFPLVLTKNMPLLPCDDPEGSFVSCLSHSFVEQFEMIKGLVVYPFVWKGWSKMIDVLKRSMVSPFLPSSLLLNDLRTLKERHQVMTQKYESLKTRIAHFETLNSIDLGVDRIYLKLYNQCTDFEDDNFKYTICLFKTITQKPLKGHSETSLGYHLLYSRIFSKWSPDYTGQVYENGAYCHSGPRSSTLYFECGPSFVITSVVESVPCAYEFTVQLPAVCNESSDHADL